MISRAMKSRTNEHAVRGRPTLMDVKRFRNGSACKPYERSIYQRTFWVNLLRIVLYQRNCQPGLSILQLDKEHLRGVIVFLDVVVNQVESQHELKNVWATRAERLENLFMNVSVRLHLGKTFWETWLSIVKLKSRTKRYSLVIFL